MSALATRVADASLGADERRALELRERTGAGYAEIASALGVEPREVAALLSSARLNLREAVRGRPVPAVASEDCARARPLLSARQDGEPLADEDRAFVRAHVEACDSCRSVRVALREGSLAVRAVLGTVVPAAPVAEPAPEAATVVAPAPRPASRDARPAPPSRRERAPRRRRRAPAVLAAAILASAVASVATILAGDDAPRRSSAAQPAATAEPTATPTPTNDPKRAAAARREAAAARESARRRRAAARRRRAARARAAATTAATAAPAAATATPQPAATPKSQTNPQQEQERRPPRRQKPAGTGGNDSETDTASGGAVIPQQPTDNPDGKPDVIPDSCSENNPDCDSG